MSEFHDDNATPPSLDQLTLLPSILRRPLPSVVLQRSENDPALQQVVLDTFSELHGAEARSRLDDMMIRGVCPDSTARILCSRLGMTDSWIDSTITRNANVLDTVAAWEAKPKPVADARFTPHILARIDYNRRRIPIFILAHCQTPTFTHIKVPDGLSDQPEAQQHRVCADLIADYRGSEKAVRCTKWFHEPFGFAYRRGPCDVWEFSPEGEFLYAHQDPVFEPGRATLVIDP